MVMNAVVLCAGFATRMHPLTENHPKPLLAVGGRPALDYIVDQIVNLPRMEAVHIVSNAKFYSHFLKWRDRRTATFQNRSIPIHILNDGATASENRLGAVADLFLALQDLPGPEKVLVTAGDNIFLFPIQPIWQHFLGSDAHRVLALPETDRDKLQRTGVLELDGNDRVLRLHEKSQSPPTHWFCPPLYFFQASVGAHLRAFLKTSKNPDAPGHFIDYLCRKEPVYARRLVGWRLNIGDLDAYREADRFLHQNPF